MFHKEVNRLHFIGICGTAMASVAAACRDRGFHVSGSDDNVYPPMSTFLERRGIRILRGYRHENLEPPPDLVIVGNAIKRGNPEVERLLDEDRPYCSLPELLREFFLPGKHCVVVAGTHGKTTTTALLAWVLESAGARPSFLIGGLPGNFPDGGCRISDGPHFILEGDEYDTAFFDKRSKFVHYRPTTVILNNIEYDHADIFPDLAAVQRAFRQLLAIVPRRGLVLANGDDPRVRDVVADAPCPVRYFGLPDLAGYRIGLPGTHNQRNAAAVAVCAAALGLRPDQIQAGFDTFAGVKRRMEVRGEARGVTVLDDFAHHPTALAETLRAIRQGYPDRRVWALFEPRSNTTRRNVFQRELAESLALADGVYVTRVDRLQEIPAAQRLDPVALVAAVRQQGRPAEYLPDAGAILDSLLPQLRSGDVVAVFSNGQFDNIHDKLLARLTAQ